jgi:hypothetical protein
LFSFTNANPATLRVAGRQPLGLLLLLVGRLVLGWLLRTLSRRRTLVLRLNTERGQRLLI